MYIGSASQAGQLQMDTLTCVDGNQRFHTIGPKVTQASTIHEYSSYNAVAVLRAYVYQLMKGHMQPKCPL